MPPRPSSRPSGSALAMLVLLLGCGQPHDPSPTVALASPVRGALTIEREGRSTPLDRPARVERGATARTHDDGRGALSLDTGAWILLDRSTSLTAEDDAWRLVQGRVWIDASSAEPTAVRTEHGTFESEGAAFAVALEAGGTRVYCGSGEVTYRTEGGEGRLAQGETLVASGTGAPSVSPEALWDDWTGGLANPSRERLRGVERVGVLSGRTFAEGGQARLPLPVRAHEVNVEIRSDLARTEVVQTFFNARSELLEGEWAMRLPPGAVVQDFAVDTGAGFVEGTVRTVGTTGGTVPMWAARETTGSKLVWDGPERVRARVFPIAPGATVRLRVRYTEWLSRDADVRTYVYPMRPDGEAPLLGEFVLSVDTRDADARAMRAGLGAAIEGGVVRVRRSDFRPRADFALDLFDTEAALASRDRVRVHRASPEGGATTAEGPEDYLLFDVPTGHLAEGASGAAPPLELVLLLDASGATDVEDLELARGVVEAALRQLTPTDRVALRLADVRAHVPEGAPEGLVAATSEACESLLGSLARVELGGATDLGASLREAAALVAGRPRGAVLYLGDGLPTTGALDATSLRAQLAMLDAPPRFFALALGEGANLDLLRAWLGPQASAVPDREQAARAVMALLAEAARPMLRGVTLDLGEGVERVYPRGPLTVAEGGSLHLSARLAAELPSQVTVRGTRDGVPFERRLEVEPSVPDEGGDVRRRWASARLAELLDDDAGREALVELGVRFGLLTPWTAVATEGPPAEMLPLIPFFDHDPGAFAWGLGGGAPAVRAIDLSPDGQGWRRRGAGATPAEAAAAPESTWQSHLLSSDALASGPAAGDGGLGLAAAQRALALGERGPRQCYERRTLVRPDLRGEVTVQVVVDGDGTVRDAGVRGSSLADPDTEACVLTEVRGLRFPSTAGAAVTVSHRFVFEVSERALGSRRTCSEASRLALEQRRTVWAERLDGAGEASALLEVWRQARAQCELSSWGARRVLLDMMIARSPDLGSRVALYRALAADPATEAHLRRAVFARVRSLEDVAYVKQQLGLAVALDWSFFSRMWWQSPAPTARLALVRRWLEVLPDDLDLRLRLLALLEETSAFPEARRVARALRAEPLADAAVRTAVGEFWLRQGDEGEARRVWSELVEHAPLDPWARRRLGDLYRAHGWPDDAYREYQTLARLLPGDAGVWLRLARAAAGAGRIDEALRLEQQLSESTEDGIDEGAAAFARGWTMVRLARLERAAEDDAMRAAVRRRWRETGVLRSPPEVFAALTWEHPEDAPRFRVHHPGIEDPESFEQVPGEGVEHGLLAVRITEREAGDLIFEVRRDDRDGLRDLSAELLVVVRPGGASQQILRQPVVLTRTARVLRYRLGEDDALVEVPVPPAAF